MPTTRTTFTMDVRTAEQAKRLDVNVSEAARKGVEAAVRDAANRSDRDAYVRHPESDHDWDDAEVWGES
jgi:hypothetical protein